ncbi:MAG: transcriptional regulator [Nitrospirae bacterium RBG_13_39_12]|nr:MAG: transcriptional regulator [Nitrospirae bacterium RBG_13_39_12]
MIPMIDLKKQLQDIKDEAFNVLRDIVGSGQFILGQKVSEFEKKVASYHGLREAIGVASCTDALHLSIDALDIGEGDEVITSPFTFFATVEAILYTGALPVFVDVEPDTLNIDANLIEENITKKTKAILPVHLFGHPADMWNIVDIAKKHKLKVIEDCAQSFGAGINGKKTGSFGDAGCFSFYPSKNLGGCGDGGMVVLDNSKVAGRIKELRNHGSRGSYRHKRVGFNSRLDEIQAGILLIKFLHIDEYNKKRRHNAEIYNRLLPDIIKHPVEKEGSYHVFHQYTIMSPKRNKLQQKLKENGIASVIYYPVPLHLQKALKFLGYQKGDFPIAEKAARQVLSLPMYPELEESSITKIAEIIRNVV